MLKTESYSEGNDPPKQGHVFSFRKTRNVLCLKKCSNTEEAMFMGLSFFK